MEPFYFWMLTSAVGLLSGVIGYIGHRVLSQLDELREMMATELRGMDVRLTRIEAHLWPDRRMI